MEIRSGICIRKKIPAFTLMEVTISMLIAAIAIGITYTAYHIVTGTYQDYIKKQDRVAIFLVADKLLKRDFMLASRITRNADGLILEQEAGQVSYAFAADFILRDQFALQVDTFKIPMHSFRLSFEGQEAADGEPVDELLVQTSLQDEELSLIYKKTYSSQDLFD